jgi:ABC-type bacteriocin/lantibiotic exporter with double-glycine peptidase domain
MGKNYFWIYIVISVIIFVILFISMPKIIRLTDKLIEKKWKPKKEASGEEKKNRYKTF